MIELPEALTLAAQLNDTVRGKTVAAVYPPTRASRFCWYAGDPAGYNEALKGNAAMAAEGFGIFAELAFDNGLKLCLNDGVNPRLIRMADAPEAYQLLIEFEDGDALLFTVQMYGGMVLHDGHYDNEYYQKSRQALSPFSPGFPAHYCAVLDASKPSLSLKAFLATEQRFPGIGNGVLQDILLTAGLHPKRKLASLSGQERARLLDCIVSVLEDMAARGGRDTEKDLYGTPGGYRTRLSRHALATGCPVCGGPVTKEAYLGGAVYYCPRCQPFVPA